MTHELLDRIRRGTAGTEEIRAAGDHARTCEQCAGAAADGAAVAIWELRDWLTSDSAGDVHLHDQELTLLLRRSVGVAEREVLESHLEDCNRCNERLRALASRARTRRRIARVATAAAVLSAIALSLLLTQRQRDADPPQAGASFPRVRPVTPPESLHADPEWARLVEETLDRGSLPAAPILRVLHRDGDTLRGGTPVESGSFFPMGEVVDAVRPQLTWPAARNATYVVSVYEGDREVARSRRLTHASWMVAPPLRRGRTYVWQVQVGTENGISIIPAYPAAQAVFAVTSAEDHESLERARATRPDDHLLLAILCARAGVMAEARRELARAESSDSRVARLKRAVSQHKH